MGLQSLATTVAGVMRTQGPPKADLRGEVECQWYDERVTGQAGFVEATLVHPNGITRPGASWCG